MARSISFNLLLIRSTPRRSGSLYLHSVLKYLKYCCSFQPYFLEMLGVSYSKFSKLEPAFTEIGRLLFNFESQTPY